ncbi:MAG: ROK family protein [Nanoarchaeota archaeon]
MAESKVVAVDLGGTNLRAALIKSGKILRYTKRSTPKTKEKLLETLVDVISEVFDKDVKAIGMGSPGPMSNGVIQNPPNIPLRNFDLKKFLQKKFKVRVEIENDARCVALSESKLGCRKKNFIIFTLGTGIGGGIIVNGNLYKGRGNAGEFGAIIIDNGKTFEKWWQEYRKDFILKDLMKSKDPSSAEIVKNLVSYLGKGIGSLINSFDPEIVVLMGGSREAGKSFLGMIKKEAYKYVIFPKKPLIVWSKLNHPGLLGASLLVR